LNGEAEAEDGKSRQGRREERLLTSKRNKRQGKPGKSQGEGTKSAGEALQPRVKKMGEGRRTTGSIYHPPGKKGASRSLMR